LQAPKYQHLKGKPSVFIAAGIGITPVVSMLKSISKTDEDVYLILAAKGNNLLCFKEEINQICHNNKNIKVHIFFSRESVRDKANIYDSWEYHNKRVDMQSLESILQNRRHFNFYICGPDEMSGSLVKEIKIWKGRHSPIHVETFSTNKDGKNQIDNKKVMQVHFIKSNKTIEWDHDYKNILEFAESNDIILEAGCTFGECGACSTKIVAGRVEYNYNTAARAVRGNCLPCSCHLASDISLDA